MYAQKSIGGDDSNIPQCQILWWYDNNHQYCQQKEFCGAYMYQGLNTFQIKTECEEDLNLVQCAAEGETIPVIANPPECCSGLKLIKPKLENQLGIYGYCTAKCGNGICESETESSYNCPEDCKDIVTCNSCSDCTLKINRAKSGVVVKLANDIKGYILDDSIDDYRCINFGEGSYVTLDCDSHSIEGNGRGYGITMKGNAHNNTIKNCKIFNYITGISPSYNNLIKNNTFGPGINYRGIDILGTYGNKIINNKFISLAIGIRMEGTMNNIIEDNDISNSSIYGILLKISSDNTVKSNKITGNKYGIGILTSNNNSILNNEVTSNGFGIYLAGVWGGPDSNSRYSFGNILDNNLINNNKLGVYVVFATENTLKSNTICWNNEYGDIKRVSGGDDERCNDHGSCFSHCCSNNVCASSSQCGTNGGGDDSPCTKNNDCHSGCCKNNICVSSNQCGEVPQGSNTGYNNKCDKAEGWNDKGVLKGCMFKCPILQSSELPSYIGSREFVLEEPKQKIEKKAEPEINLIRSKGKIEVYEIINNEKLWIPTAEAFNNTGYKWTDVQDKTETEVNNYPRLKLARIKGDTKVYYLTEDGQKRWMPNPEIFNSYGNKWEDVVELRQSNLDIYEDTAIIRLENGIKVYKLENNTKRWIKTAAVFNRLGFDWNKIVSVNSIEFNYYKEGLPIK